MALNCLSSLRADVRRVLGQGSSGATPTDDELDAFIKAAVAEMLNLCTDRFVPGLVDTGTHTIIGGPTGVTFEYVDLENVCLSELHARPAQVLAVYISQALITGVVDGDPRYRGRRVDPKIGMEARQGHYTRYSNVEPIWWLDGYNLNWHPIVTDLGVPGSLGANKTGFVDFTVIMEPDYSYYESQGWSVTDYMTQLNRDAVAHLAAYRVYKALGLNDLAMAELQIGRELVKEGS